jgi:hypothetical protein
MNAVAILEQFVGAPGNHIEEVSQMFGKVVRRQKTHITADINRLGTGCLRFHGFLPLGK